MTRRILRSARQEVSPALGSGRARSSWCRPARRSFIAQEIGREVNTLGSKSNQSEMQILVVKMKDELEQIKEQVLNTL
ncbi:MAG: DUF1732 domain-containing protein, partial [Paludibacteraceae bacterium]|nr:DUF1732 domain-containing protein [Paludibacteraceae bacterium]